MKDSQKPSYPVVGGVAHTSTLIVKYRSALGVADGVSIRSQETTFGVESKSIPYVSFQPQAQLMGLIIAFTLGANRSSGIQYGECRHKDSQFPKKGIYARGFAQFPKNNVHPFHLLVTFGWCRSKREGYLPIFINRSADAVIPSESNVLGPSFPGG